MTPEGRLTAAITAALRARGAWVLKYHVGPYSRPGTPDLLACYQGCFVALEVKTHASRARVTPLQRRALDMIRAAGGTAQVVTSIDEALTALGDR